MTAYYNEFDRQKAAWLRELMTASVIAPGIVDERSILDVRPADLEGFRQVHLFAGVGVWSYALRCAGWTDDRPVWTASCPCQPFSAAGKGGGFADERHLWPAVLHLFRVLRPVAFFGEQVSSRDGLAWLDVVQSDLEGEGYTVGTIDSSAAGFGSPHRRHRLYILAHPFGVRPKTGIPPIPKHEGRAPLFTDGGPIGRVGLSSSKGLERHPRYVDGGDEPGRIKENPTRSSSPPGAVGSFWEGAEWIYCKDDKWRPAEPGTFPLAHGAAARVGRLRGYGDCIVAPQAEAFVRAYMEEAAG